MSQCTEGTQSQCIRSGKRRGRSLSLFFLVILKFKYKSGDIKINKMSEVPELYRKDLLMGPRGCAVDNIMSRPMRMLKSQ